MHEDLTALARALVAERRRKHGKCFWNVVGSAEKHPELYARYRQDVIEPRREVIRRVLRRGMATGELRAGLDLEVVVALLVGPLTIRTPQEGLPQGFPEAVVNTLMRGIGVDAE